MNIYLSVCVCASLVWSVSFYIWKLKMYFYFSNAKIKLRILSFANLIFTEQKIEYTDMLPKTITKIL